MQTSRSAVVCTLSWHFTLQNGVTAVDIAVPGIINFLSKGMYKILLDASGLTEQEHKVFTISMRTGFINE